MGGVSTKSFVCLLRHTRPLASFCTIAQAPSIDRGFSDSDSALFRTTLHPDEKPTDTRTDTRNVTFAAQDNRAYHSLGT